MTDDIQASSPAQARTGAGPIEEGFFADINGLRQWITIRGTNAANPVLLLVGGPGFAFSALAPFFAPWEQFFTLAQWDQPGAGATHATPDNPPLGALTLARLVSDGAAVAALICSRRSVDKIWIMGFSGGSTVGLMLARQRPDLFHGYIGCGQVVHWVRQDALSYELIYEQARVTGDASARAELERIGAPPYADSATDAIKAKYAAAMTAAERAAFAALDASTLAGLAVVPAQASYVPKGVKLEEPRGLSFKTYDKLRGDLVSFDAASLGARYEIPLVFLQGEFDAFTVTSEVQRFIEQIEAPRQELVTIPGGGHNCIFLRDLILQALKEHTRPVAVTSVGGAA